MKQAPIQIAELELTFAHREGLRYRVEPEFADYLTDGLDATGKTVVEIAKSIGLAPRTLYQLINGTTKTIQRSTAKKLARLSFMTPEKDTGAGA